jgi:predicted RNase H-like HicB family nuclease
MTRYIGLLDGAEGAYGIAFPDLAGCTAMGTTADEAYDNAVAALAEWLADAGSAGPPPRSIEALRRDPDVIEALSEGALAVAVPVIIETGRPVKANLSLDQGLLAAIDAAARARGITRSAFVASAARDKILAGG